MTANLIISIKNKLYSLTTKVKKLLSNIDFWDYLTVALCFLCSGYALFTTGNTTPRTVTTLLTCLIVICRYVLSFNTHIASEFKNNKKTLIPTPTIICFGLLGLAAAITLFLNKETMFFISYVYFGISVICAFLLCRIITFQKFAKIFCEILALLCCISITIFFIQLISGSIIGFSFFELKYSIVSNFLYINFQNIFLNRIQSIFWEPGVFASFVLIGSAFELMVLEKKNYFRLGIFLFSLILTFSTAGYFLYLLIAAIFIDDIFKKTKFKLIYEILFFPLLALFVGLIFAFPTQLSKILPSVFGKLVDATQSFTTRLYSPLVNLEIFKLRPIFGSGIQGANSAYAEAIIKYSTIMDAQTSTTTSLLSKFGIFGIIPTFMLVFGILFYEKKNIFKLICLTLLMLFIINKEPHENILITWILMFYFVYESFDKKTLNKRFSHLPVLTLKQKIFHTNQDSSLAKNTIVSIIIKGIALLVSFFSVPIFSKYFSNDIAYGVWLTILSIINWVVTFDLGLGNGMKNKLIHALAKNDEDEGKQIVSSTYLSSTIIGIVILAIGLVLINTLNLGSILKIDFNVISSTYVKLSFSIVFATIAIEFILKNISNVLQAHQKHAASNSLPLIATVLLQIFAVFFGVNASAENKLLSLSIVYCVGSLLPYITATLICFLGPYKNIRPSYKKASFSKAKSVMSLGLMFFMIQLGLLFLNSMDQFVLSNIFGPESVVFYTKYSKPFHIIITLVNAINAINWAKMCELYSLKDIHGINALIKKILYTNGFAIILCMIVLIFMQPLLDTWLGSSTIKVDFRIAILIFIFTIESIFVNSFASILNGFQYLKPQAISVGISAVLKIPLIYLLHYIFPSLGWWILFLINDILWAPIIIAEIIGVKKIITKIKKELKVNENK